jgi:hypothetical protein
MQTKAKFFKSSFPVDLLRGKSCCARSFLYSHRSSAGVKASFEVGLKGGGGVKEGYASYPPLTPL